jgi:hypothetical protein
MKSGAITWAKSSRAAQWNVPADSLQQLRQYLYFCTAYYYKSKNTDTLDESLIQNRAEEHGYVAQVLAIRPLQR